MHRHATAGSMPYLHMPFTFVRDGTCFHTFLANHFTVPVVLNFATVMSLFGKWENRKADSFRLKMVVEQ